VLAIALVPIVLARRAWTNIGEAERALHLRQLHLLQQSLGAVKDVIITGRQAFFEAELRRIRRALAGAKERRTLMASAARLGVEAVLILCMLLAVFAFTRQAGSTGEGISVLALFAYTGFRTVPSANRIMLNVGYLREGEAWARSVDHDMAALTPPAPRHFAPEPELPFKATLACEHVTVAYDEGAPPAIQDVSLTIRRGESIGIVGPTGAGKSTLVDALLGLVRPASGRVCVDGVSIEGRERAWQRRIGYVPQGVYLLDDSLRRNIAFGVPDSTIDEARLWRAVSLARLDPVVNALPERLDTVVGERGVRLSGGQRQRVAIARALYHDPDLLVFDEATAALDSQTERELTAAIAELHGERTLIAIAHRISTVQTCDRLIFLQGGRVVGIGPYRTLLADPAFRALV
jgi:ATP-binding cassette subfamily C protein